MKAPYLRVHIDTKHPGRPATALEITASLQKQIESNVLAQGCRLPPVRVLAHQLGISKNTVQAAYDELVSRDLLVNEKRKGFFIKEKESYQHQSLSFQAAETKFHAASKLPPLQRSSDYLDLGSIFIDPDLMPENKITECFRSVLRNPGLQYFYDLQGYGPLREMIAQRLEQRGIPAKAEHLIITSGSQQALDLVCRALRGNKIATENPTYRVGKSLFESYGFQTTPLPLNPFQGIDLNLWHEGIRAATPDLLYFVSSFNNPTGYSYTTQELQGILSLSQQYGFGILEDDWGSEMLSFSEYSPPLRSLGGENVLYMNSFTKKLLPSLRVGYLLANEQSVTALLKAKYISSLAHPLIVEAALFEFLDRGYYDSHLKNLHQNLDQRYQSCLQMLRQFMPEEVQWTAPGGGTILWLELPQRVNIEDLARRMAQKGVRFRADRSAFFGTPHLHGLTLGFAWLKEAQLSRGLELLSQEIKQLL
ncbi:MAG: hypothetical protein COB67_07635 [SAR324 cluster bacterium]|uniref:HTH gntR-type domain-containing protein n=1 Tax=SAR324 cluster bacterium TaxID=2024889 RepID=A0A2A4T377_9DELT|nr:MAG: hypothetical protein COB67_07635 [SAR324 cluster bacterium]